MPNFDFVTSHCQLMRNIPEGVGGMARSSSEVFFDLLHKLLFIPRGGIEVGLLYGQGKPLGREHADGGTTREEGRDEVGRGAQGELKVGVLGGGA